VELTNTPSVCPLCSVGCNIILGVKNNELCRITPRENMEVNDTWICDKGRFAHAFVDHSDRLTVPLIRRDGYLQPATWDEALDLIARRFAQSSTTGAQDRWSGLDAVTNEQLCLPALHAHRDWQQRRHLADAQALHPGAPIRPERKTSFCCWGQTLVRRRSSSQDQEGLLRHGARHRRPPWH
jgi:anaerobic selenocysteine-containing dehydrogenase